MTFDNDMDILYLSNEKAKCEIGITEKYVFLGKGSPDVTNASLQRVKTGTRTPKGHWR